jgi:hypothetical protein
MRRFATIAAEGDREAPGPRLAWALVALLAALHAAPFLLTFVEGDFARDLDEATRLVEGSAWPVQGPVLAWTLHLGPAWYWLLALPLALTRSVAAAIAFVALLSALQYPLAYRLGAEAAGRAFGLAFAVFLALPGLATIEGLWIAHPSLVPTAMLAVALCAYRAWTLASPRWWIASMLAASLALHAHPTTLPVLLLPAAAAARAGRSAGRWRPGVLLLGVVAFLALFAPLAFDASASAAALGRFASDVSSDVGRISTTRVARALANAAWRVPDAVAGTVLSGSAGAPVAFRLALAALYAIALIGTARAIAGRARGWRTPVLAALAAFALTVAIAVAVRGTTRFYMLYAALPPLAAWLAAASCSLPAGTARRPGARTIPVALALGVFVATSGAWVLRAVRGEVRVPAVLSASADLSGAIPRGHAALPALPSAALDRIGRRVCEAGDVRALGELASVVDLLRNVPGRLACGAAGRVELGGTGGPGTPLYLVAADLVPAGAAVEPMGAFALGRADRVIAPRDPLPVAPGDSYPWRKACGPPSSVVYRFTTQAAGTLVLSNALEASCPLTLVRFAREGTDASPVWRADSRAARVPAGEANWEIEVLTGDPRGVQLFTIGGAPVAR